MSSTEATLPHTPHTPPDFSEAELIERLFNGGSAQDLVDEVIQHIIEKDSMLSLTLLLAGDPFSFLASHGANVATEEPGCAFEKLIYHLKTSKPTTLLAVASALSEIPGELPFHLLAKHHPIAHRDLTQRKHQAALSACDSNGRTVSHYLWDEQSMLVLKHQSIKDINNADLLDDVNWKIWSKSVYATWIMQDDLQKAGFGMDIPDRGGRTAMDLCIERIHAGHTTLVSNVGVCDQVRAYMTRQSLSINTSPADGLFQPRPGPRI